MLRHKGLKVENDLFTPPHPFLMPPLRGNPLEFLDETYRAKTRGMGYGHLHFERSQLCFWLFRPCDRQTDVQTDGIWMTYALSIYAVARYKLTRHERRVWMGLHYSEWVSQCKMILNDDIHRWHHSWNQQQPVSITSPAAAATGDSTSERTPWWHTRHGPLVLLERCPCTWHDAITSVYCTL